MYLATANEAASSDWPAAVTLIAFMAMMAFIVWAISR